MDIAQVFCMCVLSTITYRKHSEEAEIMGRRCDEKTLVGNRRETLRASSHPASLYVQGNFATAVGHSGHCMSGCSPSGGHGASGSLSAYS